MDNPRYRSGPAAEAVGGYVEGDGIYSGEVDVVVCDGFAGNIALKSIEGLAKMIGQNIKENFNKAM